MSTRNLRITVSVFVSILLIIANFPMKFDSAVFSSNDTAAVYTTKTATGKSDQLWVIEAIDAASNKYLIKNVGTGLYLSRVGQYGGNEGADFTLETKDKAGVSQDWGFATEPSVADINYIYLSEYGSLKLGIYDTGIIFDSWSYVGLNENGFYLEGLPGNTIEEGVETTIKSYGGFYLTADMPDEPPEILSAAVYATETATGKSDQLWVIEAIDAATNKYLIKNVGTGFYLSRAKNTDGNEGADFTLEKKNKTGVFQNWGFATESTIADINYIQVPDYVNLRLGIYDTGVIFNSWSWVGLNENGFYLEGLPGNTIEEGVETTIKSYGGFYLTADMPESFPDTPGAVTATMSSGDIHVNITGWNNTHKYQIWAYEKVEKTIFADELDDDTAHWVLKLPYTSGTDDTKFTKSGDTITRNIGPIASPDGNYTIAVKVINNEGNFVGHYKHTYTPEDIGEVKINSIFVDGEFADPAEVFVKEIKAGATVNFEVIGNGIAGMEYTANVNNAFGLEATNNLFTWDISGLKSGNYSVTFEAFNADSQSARTLSFILYKEVNDETFAAVDDVDITGAEGADAYSVTITPDTLNLVGHGFRYVISEPWRNPIANGSGERLSLDYWSSNPDPVNIIPKGMYGIYEVSFYGYREGVNAPDDGIIRSLNYSRGSAVNLNVNVNENPVAGVTEVNKGDNVVIFAQSPELEGLPEGAVYSFWRRDANGWVLVRDYGVGQLTWVPNRVGSYTFQIRAKANGGLTCEVLKNIEFEVSDAVDVKANVNVNDINLVYTGPVTTRIPISIKAEITNAPEDLLYKYIISNDYIYYVETKYSNDNSYIFVPGKPGEYSVSVLVKNGASFGKYDAEKTFTVNVG